MTRKNDTICLHLEEDEGECRHYGSVSFPIYQSATYAHPALGQSTGFDYSRLQNPTREHLEKVVAQLEGGIDAFALSSGMAAISLLSEIFTPGDEIIVDSDLYGGTIRLFDHVLRKHGIKIITTELYQSDIEKLITPNTKAVYFETPTNPMMNVIDIEKTAQIAHKHGLIVIVDNTFLSPYFQNPLKLGADVVVHSGTKFLGGHNDTLSGFIVTNNCEIQEKLRFLIKTIGAGLAPFDCWLIERGIKTLAVRMEKAEKNAIQIADFLAKSPKISRVIYPGLKTHPGYEIIKRQSRGFGSMITFEVENKALVEKILREVRLIKFAESLGGVETLITYPTTQTHADVPEDIRLKNGITDCVLRLSVGIENADDLIEELKLIIEN